MLAARVCAAAQTIVPATTAAGLSTQKGGRR